MAVFRLDQADHENRRGRGVIGPGETDEQDDGEGQDARIHGVPARAANDTTGWIHGIKRRAGAFESGAAGDPERPAQPQAALLFRLRLSGLPGTLATHFESVPDRACGMRRHRGVAGDCLSGLGVTGGGEALGDAFEVVDGLLGLALFEIGVGEGEVEGGEAVGQLLGGPPCPLRVALDLVGQLTSLSALGKVGELTADASQRSRQQRNCWLR